MDYNKKTLRDWAYSCMPPEKAKSFLNYYKGCLYKISDKKVSLLREEDLVPQCEFEIYHNDFENFVTTYDYLGFKAAGISSTAFYFNFTIKKNYKKSGPVFHNRGQRYEKILMIAALQHYHANIFIPNFNNFIIFYPILIRNISYELEYLSKIG